MAWTKGELITASKLNSENAPKMTSTSCSNPSSKGSTTSAWHYIHQNAGRFMYLRTKGTAYWWAEGTAWVEFRDASGNVSRVSLWNGSDTTNRTIERTLNVENFSYGPGWYRGYAWVNRGYGYVDVYWGQDNCWKGGMLTLWDSPTNSGNRIAGERLTADVLNSGRVGTI